MKVLIIRFSSIGDIVLTTPVIRATKEQVPNVEVHFCTKQQYASILTDNPYLDKLHLLRENGLSALVKTLKKEKFDFIIDLHNNLRTAIIKLQLRRPSKAFDKLNFKKWLLVKFKLNLLPSVHIVDRYFQTAAPIGVIPDDKGLDFFIPERDKIDPEWLPVGFRESYVAVVVGAKFATKRLPFKRLVELCDRINRPIILLGGKEDTDIGEKVEAFFDTSHVNEQTEKTLQKELNKRTTIFNGCGKFNLNQSAYLLKNAQAVFTHDTGLMHIAAAFQKPIYSIWGNTTPYFGMYPYKTKFIIFENNDLDCRPCSKIGFGTCPKGHFKCMNDVKFDFYLE